MRENDYFNKVVYQMISDGLHISVSELDTSPGFHRCGTQRKPKSQDGSYIIYINYYSNCSACFWKDWSTGIKNKLYSKSYKKMIRKKKKI